MSKPLPFQWLTGADTPNSLAQQAQANFDALAQGKDDEFDFTSIIRLGGLGVALQTTGADVSGSFTLPKESNVLLVYFASGFTTVAGVNAFVDCSLNGVYLGSCQQFYNDANLHLQLSPYARLATLGAGTHTVRVAPGGSITRDANDTATVIYVAFG